MNSGFNNRHKKRQRIRASYIWAALMTVCAVAAIFAAVWVVIAVYEKIAGDSSEWVLESSTEETEELEIQKEEMYGWITDENGSRYREDDGFYAADTWKIWEEKLYYLKEDGYMATEDVRKEGQVFYFESDGALRDIQLDSGWKGLTGDDNLQNLDSLVKSYEFWGYRSSDASYTGLFKPICYRKTTETKERLLGGNENPEVTTKNSLQIHEGYLYYLPQVTPQAFVGLSQNEQSICNKLFRMKPGESKKELLAENATGYLILEDGTIYYASNGQIREVAKGTVYSVGDEQYHVQIKDNDCYLIDSMGEVVTGDENRIQVVGSRRYYLDDNGKIVNVLTENKNIGNFIYTLEADGQNAGTKALYKQGDGGQKVIAARSPFGIDSFCIAEGKIYYSAQVAKEEDGTRYSELYQMEPDGIEAKKIGQRFKGNFFNLYYYAGQQKLYGEYVPVSWKNCYGQIAEIGLDGYINVIDDSAFRGSSDQNSNELLLLLMAEGNTITTYLRTCEYDADEKTWTVLSEKPYQFSDRIKVSIDGTLTGIDSDRDKAEEESSEKASEKEKPTSSQREENRPAPSETESTRSVHSETESTRPASSQTESTRVAPSETETVSAVQAETEGTRPVPDSEQVQPGIARPKDPGDAPTVPTTEAAGIGDGNEIPTIEANPESNLNQIPEGNSDSVSFIGPGGV